MAIISLISVYIGPKMVRSISLNLAPWLRLPSSVGFVRYPGARLSGSDELMNGMDDQHMFNIFLGIPNMINAQSFIFCLCLDTTSKKNRIVFRCLPFDSILLERWVMK